MTVYHVAWEPRAVRMPTGEHGVDRRVDTDGPDRVSACGQRFADPPGRSCGLKDAVASRPAHDPHLLPGPRFFSGRTLRVPEEDAGGSRASPSVRGDRDRAARHPRRTQRFGHGGTSGSERDHSCQCFVLVCSRLQGRSPPCPCHLPPSACGRSPAMTRSACADFLL